MQHLAAIRMIFLAHRKGSATAGNQRNWAEREAFLRLELEKSIFWPRVSRARQLHIGDLEGCFFQSRTIWLRLGGFVGMHRNAL